MSSKGSGYVRVKARTKFAIEKIAGKIQSEKGGNVSADSAIWSVIEQYLPDIAKEAIEKTQDSEDEDSHHNEN